MIIFNDMPVHGVEEAAERGWRWASGRHRRHGPHPHLAVR